MKPRKTSRKNSLKRPVEDTDELETESVGNADESATDENVS